MRTREFHSPTNRGSALLAVILVIAVMSYLAASSLSYSVQAYRSSMRQVLLDKAKLSAEAEMEVLYFQWITAVKENVPEEDIDSNLLGKGVVVDFETVTDTSLDTPMLTDIDWEISRVIRSNGPARLGTTSVSGVSRPAQINYFTALTRASTSHPLLGEVNYQMGRRFALSRSSLFQFSVFYQDVMEFSTGSPMTIKGDISSNGSLYIGAQNGVNLTVVNKIFFADTFNGVSTQADAVDVEEARFFRHNSDVPNTLDNPTFSSDEDEEVARKNQIRKLDEPENFLGGTNVDLMMELYGPAAAGGTGAYASENDVYRSVISPIPKNAIGVAIPEDPVIKANRIAVKAGITIEVRKTTDLFYAISPVKIYTKDAPNVDYSLTNPALVASIVTATREELFDTRENTNVKVTTIDISKLKDALVADTTPAALKNAFNGIVYAYDPNPQNPTTGTVNAIRVVNADELPYKAVSGNPLGFTLASDNGIYIQGNYNTVTPAGVTANTEDNSGNPSAIMADAITLLSENWDDDNATADVTEGRKAGNIEKNNDGTPVLDGDGNPVIDTTNTVTAVYAALISGNTATNTAAGVNSGGVQNLIRLMENWEGQTVKLVGSLGQLFESKYFTGAIRATGSGTGKNLYLVPDERLLTFDSKLATTPPPGAQETTKFSRGDYFIWQLRDDPLAL